MTPPNTPPLDDSHGGRLATAMEAARAAGRLLLAKQGRIGYREKAVRDLVTEADLAAQDLILEQIRRVFPEDEFLGEEDQPRRERILNLRSSEALWVVDPLDGTTNFVHGLPHYCVSIGFLVRGEPVLGVVYDPHRDELFRGVRGKGAWLGEQRLEASRCERLETALVAVSFAARVASSSPEVTNFLRLLSASQAVRRLGSAALNLAYTAAGRFDAYWARSGKIWDVAAGVLLVEEAGGIITGVDGERFDVGAPHVAAAATASLHREMMGVIRQDME